MNNLGEFIQLSIDFLLLLFLNIGIDPLVLLGKEIFHMSLDMNLLFTALSIHFHLNREKYM